MNKNEMFGIINNKRPIMLTILISYFNSSCQVSHCRSDVTVPDVTAGNKHEDNGNNCRVSSYPEI